MQQKLGDVNWLAQRQQLRESEFEPRSDMLQENFLARHSPAMASTDPGDSLVGGICGTEERPWDGVQTGDPTQAKLSFMNCRHGEKLYNSLRLFISKRTPVPPTAKSCEGQMWCWIWCTLSMQRKRKNLLWWGIINLKISIAQHSAWT